MIRLSLRSRSRRTVGIFVWLVPLLLAARFTAHPAQTCAAFNNLKHTQNTHHVHVSIGQEYPILRKHKHQYLVLIRGESPAQRWVDTRCFSHAKSPKVSHDIPKNTPKKIFKHPRLPQPTVLVASWHNAFCETHRNRAECRTDRSTDAGHLVLHGLWPQPRANAYCRVPRKIVARDKHHQWRTLPNIDTDPETLAMMDRYFPGYVSYLHKHEWIKHGTCYGTDAATYYHDALSLIQALDHSAVGKLLTHSIGRQITLAEIRDAFDRAFGAGAGRRVAMLCKQGLLTELRINLRGHGDILAPLIQAASPRKSRCHSARIDPR